MQIRMGTIRLWIPGNICIWSYNKCVSFIGFCTFEYNMLLHTHINFSFCFFSKGGLSFSSYKFSSSYFGIMEQTGTSQYRSCFYWLHAILSYSGLSGGVIAGISVAAVLIGILLFACLYIRFRRKKNIEKITLLATSEG